MGDEVVWDDNGFDFDFLPPVDDSIFNEILHGASGTPQDVPAAAPVKPKRRWRGSSWRTEMLSLHETIADLEKALQDLEQTSLQRTQLLSDRDRKWKQIARNQLELKLKALRENEGLRATVAEQRQLTHDLESIVLKKPRRMMMKLNQHQWRVLKLSAHGEQRLAAMHGIADRQLDLVESELVTSGLMDAAPDGAFRHRHVITGQPDEFYVEGMRCVQVKWPAECVADAVWQAMMHAHDHASAAMDSRKAHTFMIDQDTVYIRVTFEAAASPVKVEFSVILKKRLVDNDHVRFVFRSIFEDEAHPFAAESYVSDQHGWFDVQGDDRAAVVKSYVKAISRRDHHPPPGSQDLDDLRRLLESLHMDEGTSLKTESSPVEMAIDVLCATSRKFHAHVDQLLRDAKEESVAFHAAGSGNDE